MFSNNNRQKSPARRFLLILGIVAFIAFTSLGLMIIFWADMLPSVAHTQKIWIGIAIIVYSALRFSRLLKKDAGEV